MDRPGRISGVGGPRLEAGRGQGKGGEGEGVEVESWMLDGQGPEATSRVDSQRG